jgi:hypothetical protein
MCQSFLGGYSATAKIYCPSARDGPPFSASEVKGGTQANSRIAEALRIAKI